MKQRRKQLAMLLAGVLLTGTLCGCTEKQKSSTAAESAAVSTILCITASTAL